MQQKTHPNSIAGLFKKEPRTGLWARECYGGGLLAPGFFCGGLGGGPEILGFRVKLWNDVG